jgi:hypothetical protein
MSFGNTAFCFTIVRGELSSEPQFRMFDSGAHLVTLQVTVREPDQPTVSVPLSMWDPPAFVADLHDGDEVVAIGRVNRRFYGAGAGPRQSKVEILVNDLVPGTDKRKVAAALRRARRHFEAVTEAA